MRLYTDELLDGKYRILGRLGTGGMGEVYQAEHTFLGATRVIKVIRPQISESQDVHDRFLREARLATLVQHTNVATVHDFSALPDGSHYMVWEYIDGENLAQRLRTRGPLPPRTAVRLIIQALHGLEAIHRAGIVHRDISPENLMISRADETVKIIDLGVAKSDDPGEAAGTATGIFVGKLRYASPEQLGFLPDHEKVDGRADIYALGMVLYETLAGRPPYEATSPHQYFLMHSEDREFRPVELPPDLPGGAELQEAIRRALQRDRNKRFASAREFADALEGVERSLPEPEAMKTVALPMNFDSTMRVGSSRDTLHRTTVRTDATRVAAPASPADSTVFAPRAGARAEQAGAAPPYAPPAPTLAPAAPPKPFPKALFIVVGLLIFLMLGGVMAGGVWWFMRSQRPEPGVVASSTTGSAAPATDGSGAQPAESTVDVAATAGTDLTSTAPDDGSTVEDGTVPTDPEEPIPAKGRVETGSTGGESREPKPRTPRDEPAPVVTRDVPADDDAPPVQAETPANTYVENGDEDANERLVEKMRRELRGVTRVTVRGGAMQEELEAALREEYPELEIAGAAAVVIEFEGLIDRQGRGRKTRYASAVIRKNGKPVFRYLMPTEVYRVGNTPVEAFIGVLDDAFSQ